MRDDVAFTAATVVAAEGARVGLVTCSACGAALLLDPDVDVLAAHRRWHAEVLESADAGRG